MPAPGESTPVIYHDDAKMHNGGSGGDGSGQIVPQVVQPDQVEEVGTLVPQAAAKAFPCSLHHQDSPFHCLTALESFYTPRSTIGMLQQLRGA